MLRKILDKPRAIIADDEESCRVCMAAVLEQEGWEVTEARDGEEALEKVFRLQPNLLILDYQMPKLTGEEVYQHLQLHRVKLATILISSNLELEKLASCLGIIYYLHKPFEITDFLKTVNSACEN